jgi:hypothetical protein
VPLSSGHHRAAAVELAGRTVQDRREMAIAVMPEEPPSRWERLAGALFAAIVLVVAALFVFSMLDAYVF